MNILLLNWRDPKNPKSGGAEKLNMEILKPLIDRGDTVTWYAQMFKGAKMEESFKGVKIIRYGNVVTHFLALPFFLLERRFGNIDVCIDSIHGTGYLSSIFLPRTKKIALICEVAKEIWDDMYTFPTNVIGKAWEKVMFSFYKNSAFWTISESTKKDLVSFSIKSKNIAILPMGFDGYTLSNIPKKSNNPTALYVGRLAHMKGIDDAIKALEASKEWSLKVLGKGSKEYESYLKKMVSSLNLTQRVQFLGFVTEQEKFEEMAKAWAVLVPSRREGWGMIVPESNSVGTQVIGYDVPGLRDSLRKYSKFNILIKPEIESLTKALGNIKTPINVDTKISPGWKVLHEYILKTI